MAGCFLAQAPVQIADVALEPGYTLSNAAQAGGWRSGLAVPILLDSKAIGVVGVGREQPGAFAPRLVSLLQTFADQAVIAIENARLFNETQRGAGAADGDGRDPEGHRQLAVGRAAGVRRHRRRAPTGWSAAISTTVFRIVDGVLHLVGFTPTNPQADAALASDRSRARSPSFRLLRWSATAARR